MRPSRGGVWSAICAVAIGVPLSAAEFDQAAAVRTLRNVDPRVIENDEQSAAARDVVRRSLRNQLDDANRRSTAAWREVQSHDDWEAFRDPCIERLRASLSLDSLPNEPRDVRITRTISGDGFTIDNVVFTSRPGVFVTANLYRPAEPRGPAIVICHSHHAPKTQGELQDMGMSWARRGTMVLVPDQLGHGERRTHSFGVAGRYPRDYKPDRQDYYFRYNTGLQLALVGESLIGWMVGDLMCCITLLIDQPGVNAEKIILLGAVAGGGDPAGVTAALDPRVAAVAPFNYGGYEPEDVYPLPENAEETFDYAGSGSWESTRNLRLSARDGFLPWTVAAAAAPRYLVYAHEFRWDEPRDPVWKRLGAIYTHYGVRDRLASAHGRGTVKGRPPEASHCTNIGPTHRTHLHPPLEKWLDVTAPDNEYSARRPSDELRCRADAEPFALHEVLQSLADARLAAARQQREGLDKPKLRQALRDELAPLLGDVEPARFSTDTTGETHLYGYLKLQRVLPYVEESYGRIPLPTLILSRVDEQPTTPPPVVVLVAQEGKAAVLQQRAEFIAECLARGAVVVLSDLRDTGETAQANESRGRQSGATSRSSSAQMLGQTMLGLRVRDLRTLLAFLRDDDGLKGSRFSLCGVDLVDANAPAAPIAAPLDAADLPKSCETLGATACLLAGLWDDEIAAVVAADGLQSFRSLLEGPYFYVPHDAVVPGLLAHADVEDLIAAQSARVQMLNPRDAANHQLRTDDDASVLKTLFP